MDSVGNRKDLMIRHALKVDKVLRGTREELKQEFKEGVFTPKGYALFRKHREKFLMKVQAEMLKGSLQKHTGELMAISEQYKQEMVK